ncbi:MAG: hypothetical protein OXH07_05710 [Chloroflexi bacterium]|nr:hypothetical protein [Chloroflexota bacterium]
MPGWRKAALGAAAGSLALALLAVVIVVAAPTGDDASPPRTSPAAGETPPEGACLTSEEERYLLLTFRETVLIGAALGSLTEYFLLAGDEPSLFADRVWRSDVLLALGEIETGASNLQAVDPPTARTEAVHRHLVAAATHYREGIRLTELALDRVDGDLLERGRNAINAGGEATERASAAVQAICSRGDDGNGHEPQRRSGIRAAGAPDR